MSKAMYWQRGESIDYVNGGSDAIAANTVVILGQRIGVAGEDIPVGATGSLHVTGVFKMEKAAEEITAGTEVYLDPSGKITAAASTPGEEEGEPTAHVKAGFVIEKAASADTYAVVKINA